MSTTMQFPLLDLPNELIIRVVEFVDGLATLSRIACTSKRMQELVEPILYRCFLVKDPTHAKTLLAAFEGRPQRALAVQDLQIPANPKMAWHRELVGALLTKVRSVKELMIESPLVNSDNFETEDFWNLMADHLFQPFKAALIKSKPSTRPLQKLTSLTLHLNGPLSPYWELDWRSVCIFQHHTIQKIHVSCMNLGGDALLPVEERFCTPLKHLILEECNITVPGLKNLLNLPKALEILYLGENCYNFAQFKAAIDPAANLLFHVAPEQTLEAIKSQAHSLKALTYATNEHHAYHLRYRATTRVQHVNFENGGFADFLALEKIHLIRRCANFEHAVLCGRSPPLLRELSVDGYYPLWKSGCRRASERPTTEDLISAIPFLRVNSPRIPESLTRMTINYIYNDGGTIGLRESEGTTIAETAKVTKERFGLTLSVGYKCNNRFFPPFLHGEPLPKEGLWYDGASGTFSEEFKKEVRSPPYPFDDSNLNEYISFH